MGFYRNGYAGGVYTNPKTSVRLDEIRIMGAPVSGTPRRERAEKLNLKPIQA